MKPSQRRNDRARRRAGRGGIRFDCLEVRRLFDAGLSGWSPEMDLPPVLRLAAVEPAPGSILPGSPATLTITFDRPVDPSSAFNNIRIDRADDAGAFTPIDFDKIPLEEFIEPDSAEVTVRLGGALEEGRYRIVLVANSYLMGTDGSPLDTSTFEDRTIGEFAVVERGATLADADELGRLGLDLIATDGRLDLQANPEDVSLYRFELPEGHRWRVGVEVSAQRDGSPLDSALALFDAQGRPIAVAEFGRSDAKADPYLFADLAPGTYYLGVSGSGNLADLPGGYNPAAGFAGSLGQAQPGGTFRLNVIADFADEATRVLDVQLERADPDRPTPTGFTLAFSGAIRAPQPTAPNPDGLILLDSEGRSWPISALAYDETTARLTYVFGRNLPAGRYTIRHDGLVDLAGSAPVASDQADGVLGRFEVLQSAATDRPGDFGAVLPDAAGGGIGGQATLAADQSIEYRLVITMPGSYTFGPGSLGPLPLANIRAADGSFDSAFPADSPINLAVGVYSLRIAAPADRALALNWRLTLNTPTLSSLVGNGVGQGPALNLRLVAPTARTSTPDPVDSTTPDVTENSTPPAPDRTTPDTTGAASSAPTKMSQVPATSTESASPTASLVRPVPTATATPTAPTVNEPAGIDRPAAPAPTVTVTAPASSYAVATKSSSTPAGPAGLMLAFGGTLVGRPSTQNDRITPIGLSTTSGGTALASNSAGLPAGIDYGASSAEIGESVSGPIVAPGESGAELPDPAPAGAEVPTRAVGGPVASVTAVDEPTWFEQLVDWLSPNRVDAEAMPLVAEVPADPTGRDAAGEEEADDIVEARISPPIGIAMATYLLFRRRDQIRNLAKRARKRAVALAAGLGKKRA